MIVNLVIGLAGLIILSLALVPIIDAWLRSRQPAPTCGNWRYFHRHFDGSFCDRRAIWRLRTDPACNVGEVDRRPVTARLPMGLEAHVIVIDKSQQRLYELDLQFGSRLHTRAFATRDAIECEVMSADLVIGAVLVPGAAAPKLVTREMVKRMKRGSVLVDISIDQGGCFETSRATTHDDPTYVVDDTVHYCVANMPGAVARTSTFALNNATLPFALALADKGAKAAMLADPHLLRGLNVHRGRVTYEAVAGALGLAYTPADKALAL